MAGLLDRIEERAGRYLPTPEGGQVKGFTMPPFWATDGARVALATTSSWTPGTESGGDDFEAFVSGLYKANGPIFGAVGARARVFSQARFQMQQMKSGRPSDLFDDQALRILETPWANGSTANLLSMMEVDASLAGNFFATIVDGHGRIGRRARRDDDAWIVRLRPDWCTLIVKAPSGNPWFPDARVVGLRYTTPTSGAGMEPGATTDLLLTRREFIHYAPVSDPTARWRGMSWITPVVQEAAADAAYTRHKLAFLRNGATPNLVVKMDPDTEEDEFLSFVAQFRDEYEGASNAYKTLFLGGGADVVPLSVDFKQLDMKAGQGAIETRIAMAGGVHPVIAGFSEGLQGSSLNDGNFKAARRLFVDSTIRDLWAKACPPLEGFATPPRDGTRLWYDARDIPFLREDAKDEAETFAIQMQAARTAVDGGWKPDAAVKAAKVSDIAVLVGQHTGRLSVQLHDPNESPADANAAVPDPNKPAATGEGGTNADQDGPRAR